MFSLFRKKDASKREPLLAYAHLNAKIMPIDRGERFEDPLQVVLEKTSYAAVGGGGTMQGQSGEIEYCGVDIDIYNLDKAVPLICSTLTELGAPRGSRLEYTLDGKDAKIPFGNVEGLAIYLNGTDLPMEVYKTSDINVVIDTINELIEGHGSTRDYWEGPRETALYLYGDSAEGMQAAIAAFLAAYPLCEKARVVRIA